MENPRNIDNPNNNKTSRMYQMLGDFSDKIWKRFNRKPEMLEKRNLDKCEKCNRVKVKKDKKG